MNTPPDSPAATDTAKKSFPKVLGLALKIILACGVVALLVCLATGVFQMADIKPPAETAERVDKFPGPRVTWVRTSFATKVAETERHQLRLEDKLVVTVTYPRGEVQVPKPTDTKQTVTYDPRTLEGWMAKVRPPTKPEDTGNAINKLVPFIDGRAIKGTYPVCVCRPVNDDPDSKVETAEFHYQLKRNDLNKDAWGVLLARPGLSGANKPVTFTLGAETGETMASDFGNTEKSAPADQKQVQLMMLSKWWPFPVGAALFTIVLLWMARSSDLLRDTNYEKVEGGDRPYSLAKLQMAVWFVIVLGAYLLIWFVTRARPEVPGTALTLIGLSSATAIGALIIDGQKRATRRDLEAKVALTEGLLKKSRERQATDKEVLELETKAEAAGKELADLGTFTGKSEGLLTDILNDGNGVTLHRLQIVMWTVVLCAIFIVTTWRSLIMPEFDEGLLALMGISSGAYLGFKGVEKGSKDEKKKE